VAEQHAHFEAVITFLRTEEGGRASPVFTGYRPQFFYGGEDWDAVNSQLVIHTLEGVEDYLLNLDDPELEQRAHDLIDNGADFVFGHGPHATGCLYSQGSLTRPRSSSTHV